ncbi:Cys-tRNA(Pro) deacylase [Ruminococcus sp.]|uniref:Cys-tRNA(Pro) deacylase n=1 Tax=Ruminococcus sp. TaxID=41978 RepID=UPI00388EED53
MKHKKSEKTNVMRILEQHKIPYESHDYTDSGAVSGMEVVQALGQEPERMFKTLVTRGASGAYYVFMVPVNGALNLKKAAKAVGEKSVAMIKSRELLPLTGYIHGGCSPIGMKKPFATTIHHTAQAYPTIMFSGGRIGCQIETSLENLRRVIPVKCADIL